MFNSKNKRYECNVAKNSKKKFIYWDFFSFSKRVIPLILGLRFSPRGEGGWKIQLEFSYVRDLIRSSVTEKKKVIQIFIKFSFSSVVQKTSRFEILIKHTPMAQWE